jgi:hypothetical protein
MIRRAIFATLALPLFAFPAASQQANYTLKPTPKTMA